MTGVPVGHVEGKTILRINKVVTVPVGSDVVNTLARSGGTVGHS